MYRKVRNIYILIFILYCIIIISFILTKRTIDEHIYRDNVLTEILQNKIEIIDNTLNHVRDEQTRRTKAIKIAESIGPVLDSEINKKQSFIMEIDSSGTILSCSQSINIISKNLSEVIGKNIDDVIDVEITSLINDSNKEGLIINKNVELNNIDFDLSLSKYISNNFVKYILLLKEL